MPINIVHYKIHFAINPSSVVMFLQSYDVSENVQRLNYNLSVSEILYENLASNRIWIILRKYLFYLGVKTVLHVAKLK